MVLIMYALTTDGDQLRDRTMEALLPTFAKHTLTPRTSEHSHAQVMAEADLEGLLPVALK
jgi:hypothetical protein